jgi:hypothetical protein
VNNITILEQPFLYASKKYNFDIQKLEKESLALYEKLTPDSGQISLKHTSSEKDRNLWEDGIGSLYNPTESGFLQEKDFTVLNSELKGSYLEEVHDIISKEYSFGRMRLMKLTGRKCMSLHVDGEKRIHIPIITNENCLMIVDNEVCHLPADGNAYLVDTTKVHTALNSNQNFDRIHLLFDLL